MTKDIRSPARLAENYIIDGTWDAKAIERLDETAIEELFDCLGARAAVELAASNVDEGHYYELDDETRQEAQALQSFYLSEVAKVRASKAAASEMLIDSATWLKIEPVLKDRDFLLRLFQRRLTDFASTFVQDVADLIGVSRQSLTVHLNGDPLTLAAEHRNRGKPKDEGVEDFRAALARSDVPEVLKRRWLVGETN
jgi:hypothetical protein